MKKSPPPSLYRHDWYFEDCPNALLARCWRYEFSREALCRNPDYQPLSWITNITAFPQVPFLDLNPRIRSAFIKRDHKLKKDLSGASPQNFLADGTIFGRQLSPTLQSKQIDTDKLDGNRHLRFQQSPGDQAEVVSIVDFVAFRIDWSLSDRELKGVFREWLKQNRPVRKRGSNPSRELAADLSALGVLRLRKGRTASQVRSYLKQNKASKFGMDQHVYRISKRAETVLSSGIFAA